MSDNGTGMTPPPNNEASGAVTSRQVGRKNPSQGIKIDRNRHGIRRETPLVPTRKTKPKKV